MAHGKCRGHKSQTLPSCPAADGVAGSRHGVGQHAGGGCSLSRSPSPHSYRHHQRDTRLPPLVWCYLPHITPRAAPPWLLLPSSNPSMSPARPPARQLRRHSTGTPPFSFPSMHRPHASPSRYPQPPPAGSSSATSTSTSSSSHSPRRSSPDLRRSALARTPKQALLRGRHLHR